VSGSELTHVPAANSGAVGTSLGYKATIVSASRSMVYQ
jgi:hypothetical protein